MALSTYKTFLMSSTDGTTWEKLIDIKSQPSLGGEPELIDVTTLSHKMKVYVEGIEEVEALSFTANYDLTDYEKLIAMKGTEKYFAVWFGGTEVPGALPTPTGSDGKFKFKGMLSVYVAEAEVNAPRDMTITITPTTEISLDKGEANNG